MEADLPGVVIVVVIFLVLDSLASAIPVGFVSRRLDAVDCPARLRMLVPWVEVGLAVGLAAGLWEPVVGVIAGGCLIAYFVAAAGFHLGARDRAGPTALAVAMLAVAVIVTFVSFAPAL